MVNPVKYHLDTETGERVITIEPVFEEIGGGDLFATGRYILNEGNIDIGEIRLGAELFEWERYGNASLEDENVSHIVKFIREYNEPELAGYLD
jgi:hypothetical protein